MLSINKEVADDELKMYHDKREKPANQGRKEPVFKLKQLVFYWIGPHPSFGSEKLTRHWQGHIRSVKFGTMVIIAHYNL